MSDSLVIILTLYAETLLLKQYKSWLYVFFISGSLSACVQLSCKKRKTPKLFWHKFKQRQPLHISTSVCADDKMRQPALNFRELPPVNTFITKAQSLTAIWFVEKTVCLCDCQHVHALYIYLCVRLCKKHQTVFVHISFVSFPPLTCHKLSQNT